MPLSFSDTSAESNTFSYDASPLLFYLLFLLLLLHYTECVQLLVLCYLVYSYRASIQSPSPLLLWYKSPLVTSAWFSVLCNNMCYNFIFASFKPCHSRKYSCCKVHVLHSCSNLFWHNAYNDFCIVCSCCVN